jgi:diguanylate cyclase (GGDEF)-like protein
MIVLAGMLMSVAVFSGVLGVFNATRAEASNVALGNRYLVLTAPVGQLRASVADFQALTGPAFSGAALGPAVLTGGAADSTTTDQLYLSLKHLLATTGETSLAPHLAAQVATYDAARAELAAFLTAGPQTPRKAQLAAGEIAADNNLDAALANLQATIATHIATTNNQAQAAARDARDDLLWCLALGFPFGIIITALFVGKALRVERRAAQRDAAQAQISRRSEFEGRLQQALEMARSESPAFEMVAQALGEAAPAMRSELLLADSSRAHFRQVLTTPAVADSPGCGVMSPDDCPAASSGQTKVFPLSTALGACPYLRDRACSALCVPVSIAGNSAGVIHVTAVDGTPPSDSVRRDVEVVARRASERFAMLRAIEVSQTQANTDSLTGLFTRRSLESQIRELHDSGVEYTVAYGDLDHFKQLNDVFGHSAGDRALRTFSQVLRDALRPTDLACRHGGEEFVIVLPACPVIEAVAIVERVRERLAERLTSGRHPAFTVSFGIASSTRHTDFEGVVNQADEALLQAKAAGRDQIVIAGDPQPRPIKDHDHELTMLLEKHPLVRPGSDGPPRQQ